MEAIRRAGAGVGLVSILLGLMGTLRAADVGELPQDFGMAYYPNAHFIKEHVFLTYGFRRGLRTRGGKVVFASTQRQLVIRPVRWLYED